MSQFKLGSISTGTLRTEDLIPKFRNTLAATGNFGSLALHEPPSDERDELAALEIALQEMCPPFVYFGTLEGDGADFGFWPDMDGLRDATGDGSFEQVFGEHELPEHGIILNVTDHSEFVVMDMERNVIWSTV